MNSIGWTYALRGWLLVLVAAGCAPDAPHDNPLDPASPSFTGKGTVFGAVSLRSEPTQPIASAQVYLSPSGPIVLSAADGSFTFPPVSAGPAALIASKAGFRCDTVWVMVDPAVPTEVNFRLDALPAVTEGEIVTRKVDAYFPGPVYYAELSANVTDPDGMADLDSVWYTVGNIARAMAFNPESHLYEATVFDYELPTNNIHWLVGKEIRISCLDDAGASTSAGNLFVTRIIEECATAVSPAEGDTADASPLLEWEPARVTFFYTLTLQIVQQHSGTQTLIWSQGKVDANLWSLRCPAVLLPGSYFWTIAIVDEFGNTSQGKPNAFLVDVGGSGR